MVSTSGMVVSLKTESRFPFAGQHGHGSRIIQTELIAQYVYALITMIEKWLTITSIIVISLIYKQFFPTILFLVFFFTLRARTGGYHAPKFWQCYVGTISTYILILWISPILVQNIYLVLGLFVISCIVILCIGTVNHPNMDLEENEVSELRKASKYVLLCEIIVIGLCWYISVDVNCIAYMSIAVILCAILLSVAKLIKQEI